jgi:cytochrome P450/ferredoxin-NADP reductase
VAGTTAAGATATGATDKAAADTGAPGAASVCPFSERARRFDPFARDYQTDPAEALRWSREGEPVFFSETLGYWVVSRYDDVKAIFRDPVTFSPAVALEKITPPTEEAQAILRRYGYAMNRTLVNEDEPMHMERRRALMDAFAPDRLETHAPMVRRLVRDRLDAVIDRGEADLVADLLWEVPLTVAMHFLGVPQADMERLKAFSAAHTVNTWGRPSPEQQREVAENVGRFWVYAGEVLERMRAEPDGRGWMHETIRKQKDLPEVVTDSYLHSMMMAIMVAAHETTSYAAANAFRRLLADRDIWDQLCETPALIPNAAEECLRHSGSVVAWRRITTRPVGIGGVAIPEGARILMVTASANHDPRRFDDPDTLDIFRGNTTDHLTFGYGAHQCLGKNLARMELRIFLEEATRRLPHMELVPGQRFTFLPNTSFRGPERVLVRWDPARNPERRDPSLREAARDFPVGAPKVAEVARPLRVRALRPEAEGVLGVVLEDPKGRRLPRWTPGAHLDLLLPTGETRMYSLCGAPDGDALEIAVLLEADSRGGSRWLHEALRPGDTLRVRGPRCHFRLDETAPAHLLVAGGIGITPVLAMADRLAALGRPFALHYCGRTRARMAFLDRIARDNGNNASLYPGDEGHRLDLARLVAEAPEGAQICACGPGRLLDALADAVAARPDLRLTVEHFHPAETGLDPAREHAFAAELADSGITVTVPPDRTLLQALRAAGVDVPSDCEEGLCGTCEVGVVEGAIDHRDRVLSAPERAASDRMMTCCSRARGDRIKLRA